jgi:hypothetical protein
MDSDFLEEYEKKEFEIIKRTLNTSNRLGKLPSPIFNAEMDSTIWSQIALSGTMICPLDPVSQSHFEKMWNISINNIPDFIQFIKDTKKVQLVLRAPPTHYKKCDYLEPIFQELSPPLFSVNVDDKEKKIQKTIEICSNELNDLIAISPEWKSFTKSSLGSADVRNAGATYMLLRHFGFNEVADTFFNNFLTNPHFSMHYILMAQRILIHPLIDPFKANLSLNVDTIQEAKKMGINLNLASNTATFPEVGSFLMKKCTCYPESMTACRDVIARYEENDLYKVYSALNNAIVDTNVSSILQRKNEMGEILDNVWANDLIEQNTKFCSYGINITCGMIGYYLAGAPGLFGSLGLSCLDNTKSQYLDQFSELISKKVASPYLVTIHDFKKKYPVCS